MIQNSTNKWKDKPCLWNEIINTVKMPISTKSINTFKAISIKIQIAFFTEW